MDENGSLVQYFSFRASIDFFVYLILFLCLVYLSTYLFIQFLYLLVCLSIYLIIHCISKRFWCIHQFICLNIHLLHRFVDRESSAILRFGPVANHLVEDLPCKMLHTKEATGAGPERKQNDSKSWVDLRFRDIIHP